MYWNIVGINSKILISKVREVKSDVISSLWITSETNESSGELIGKEINNKYKIDKYLGQGGFGIVYKVLDLNENNS